MSHPAGRVLAMLELLQSHHRLTGVDLADRLRVDERTVRRYAATLLDLGIPVTAERGRYGGYRLRPGYKLPPLMLTDDEAVAVLLGLVAAERLGLGTEAPATATALAKIRRVLPAPLAERLAAVQDHLGFTLRRADPALRPATGTLLTLGSATRQRRRVTLDYRSWRGDPSRRQLDPYGLVFHAGRWYVTGYDHLRHEVRTFRLDRIGAVSTGPERFTAPDDFDPVAQVTRSLAGVPYAHSVEVLLETDLVAARRRIPPSVGDLAEVAGGVLLRTRAEHLDGMAQLLAGLGWPFTVLRPDALRDAVRAHATRLAGWADRPGPAPPSG
ncbi:Predicted DNA-binding transcriptional regulator YafY, contains an HTH and WYL domains [Micromonospora purpureochromogenes]|uniref:Predicted DNA-binding transcriptional regulator YafY, contains an HTH and WYL domains n=1 Tax=Micromonospora purpureochromogenes TaxID=47872 RepID=A0A1C4ZD35_9ACTN|nr:YafY family protein [Micromonospora purpureochromogenes]SCF30849.1 Predicted DNA-binding transcriptional regulator YafY, contains an HTH and WYL domains [Micromonospora purpureochromogenes]